MERKGTNQSRRAMVEATLARRLRKLSVYLVTGVTLGMTGCQTNVVSISESMSQQSETIIRERSRSDRPSSAETENFELLGKSVALFLVNGTTAVPDDFLRVLDSRFRQKISESALYPTVAELAEQEAVFSRLRQLNQTKNLYLETLTQVSVSNKDLSSQIGKTLQVDNLLVLQIDRWPGPQREIGSYLSMKIRLVETATGLIIWNSSGEINLVKPLQPEDLIRTANDLSDQLLNAFYHCFKQKWHKKRYSQLRLMS